MKWIRFLLKLFRRRRTFDLKKSKISYVKPLHLLRGTNEDGGIRHRNNKSK